MGLVPGPTRIATRSCQTRKRAVHVYLLDVAAARCCCCSSSCCCYKAMYRL